MPPSLHLVTPVSSGPLPLTDPTTFVANARANGFTPAQAAALHHQRRLFSGWRWQQPSHWPLATHPMFEAVERVNTLLDGLRTPKQWASYASAPELLPFLSGDLPADALYGHLRRFGVDRSGSPEGIQPRDTLGDLKTKADWQDQSPWPFWCPEEPWTWGRLEQALQAGCLTIEDVPPPPADWTLAKASRWLGWVCDRVGLAGLSLPWASTSALDLWRVGVMLRRSELSLRQVTEWEGPLVGLAGQVSLHLGQCALFGGMVHAGKVGTPVTIVLGNHPEPVFHHEWAHALDTVMWEADRLYLRNGEGEKKGSWRDYKTNYGLAFSSRMSELHRRRRSVTEVTEDWQLYRAGILPAFQASVAYKQASAETKSVLTARVQQAVAEKWVRDQVKDSLEPLVPPIHTRFEFWLPWMDMSATCPPGGASFPTQMYDCLSNPELRNGPSQDYADWWRTPIESWARCLEVAASDSSQADYLHDPLRLPTWRPFVQRVVRETLRHWHPLWHQWLTRGQLDWEEKQRLAACPS